MRKNQNQGFVLISLIFAVAIIAVLYALYYKKSEHGGPSPAQTGQKAIEQTKENNSILLRQNLDTQNELNSIEK